MVEPSGLEPPRGAQSKDLSRANLPVPHGAFDPSRSDPRGGFLRNRGQAGGASFVRVSSQPLISLSRQAMTRSLK
jgi:hypothetical protein